MLFGPVGNPKSSSLMAEYSSLLSDAVLRHRARVAEHSARIEAELASKVKSEFIANMSHELKTPLNTVIGFSKLLTQHQQRRLSDTEIVEYATLINDAAGHLLSVINDILDISKLQSGKYALDSQEIRIEGILAGSLEAFHRRAEETNVILDASIAPDLPPIRGDSDKLKKIFSNILSNAIKFTPPNGTVAIKALRATNQGVIVLIQDSGVGMSAEEIDSRDDAVRPGRRRPFALAGRNRPRSSDRQSARRIARRRAGNPLAKRHGHRRHVALPSVPTALSRLP